MDAYEFDVNVYGEDSFGVLAVRKNGEEVAIAAVPGPVMKEMRRSAEIRRKMYSVTYGQTMRVEVDELPENGRFDQPGYKDDKEKSWPWLVLSDFPLALEQVIAVGTFGAKKYTRRGWDKVEDLDTRYREAFGRHLMEELKSPFSVDQEHGQTHVAAMVWNLLAILEKELRDRHLRELL